MNGSSNYITMARAEIDFRSGAILRDRGRNGTLVCTTRVGEKVRPAKILMFLSISLLKLSPS